MQQDNKISDFCNIVCNQIRWKKTHKTVFGEIENHLIEQRDEYINSGYTEADATDKAINDFGDAAGAGIQTGVIRRQQQHTFDIFAGLGDGVQHHCFQFSISNGDGSAAFLSIHSHSRYSLFLDKTAETSVFDVPAVLKLLP